MPHEGGGILRKVVWCTEQKSKIIELKKNISNSFSLTWETVAKKERKRGECWSEILLFGIYNYYSWQVTAELKVVRHPGVATAVINILQSKLTVLTFSMSKKI